MKLTLDISKSIEQNAETYYDSAKKAKKKVDGAKKALQVSYAKLESLRMQGLKLEEETKNKIEKTQAETVRKELVKSKQKWFHKFRWFISSEGFLVVGGRDATTNEMIIKGHVEKNDIIFHTELAGSPFFVIKSGSNPDGKNKKIGEATLKETAEACASYSKAWKLGVSSTQVFYVNPDQVSKEAKAGEYIAKGAFMIYGKRNFINADLGLAVAETKEGIMAGPLNAVKKHAIGKFVLIKQGGDKTSDAAKEIRKLLDGGDLDEIIKVLPQGVKISR